MNLRTIALAGVALLACTAAHGATPSQQCDAARLKLGGKHAQCMLKTEAAALLKSVTADYTKCRTKFDEKCAAIAAKYGNACPSPSDCTLLRDIAECASNQLPIPTTTTSTTLPCGVDPGMDIDGDGFTGAGGDCDDCDALVNPGALEILNTIDDDCDGMVDNLLASCDSGLLLASTDPLEAARALGLCKQAAPMSNGWGVISATYVRANGAAAAPAFQVGLSDSFGPNVAPLEGSRLLVLSSGRARSASQPNACGTHSCSGTGAGTAPAGFPQPVPSCPTGTSIFDDIALQVDVRVPTNAVGYRYRFNFYTFDYPSFVCSSFNDQYIALASPVPSGSINGNISFQNDTTPVSANFVLRSCSGCPEGTAELDGTGFDTYAGTPAAATSWQVTEAPAAPGAIVTLRFAIYDVGDSQFDATVLLDGFEWITSGTVTVGTAFVP